jgi:hypothetical protein
MAVIFSLLLVLGAVACDPNGGKLTGGIPCYFVVLFKNE